MLSAARTELDRSDGGMASGAVSGFRQSGFPFLAFGFWISRRILIFRRAFSGLALSGEEWYSTQLLREGFYFTVKKRKRNSGSEWKQKILS